MIRESTMENGKRKEGFWNERESDEVEEGSDMFNGKRGKGF